MIKSQAYEHCPNCGKRIVTNIVARRALAGIRPNEKFQQFPSLHPKMKTLTMTIDDAKDFQETLAEVLEFAAWVCGTTPDKFCSLHMVNYYMKKIGKTLEAPQ